MPVSTIIWGADNYFRILFAIRMMTTITSPIRKNAHHMPALKTVSTAPQPLKTNNVENKMNKKGAILIVKSLRLKIQLLYHILYIGIFHVNPVKKEVVV
jgi:hypothetical protein